MEAETAKAHPVLGAVGGVLVFLLAACGCSAKRVHEGKDGRMNEGAITLRGSIAAADEKLRAVYEIENRSDEDVYVFDAIFRFRRGQPVIDNALVYTLIEHDSITLFRGVLRIPRGKQVEAPDVPFARFLPRGHKLTGAIDAPLPLRFHNPYEWPQHEEIRRFASARLRIGYITAQDLDPPAAAKIVSDETVYSIGYWQAIDTERFLETPVQHLEVTVRIVP